jgi:signal transduction histidine kinase
VLLGIDADGVAGLSGWLLASREGTGGAKIGVRLLDEPPVSAHSALMALEEGRGAALGSVGLFSWLSDALVGAPDVRRLNITSLGQATSAAVLSDGPGLHDEPSLCALVSCFASALRRSLERERADRLGEQLVQSNRALASAQEQLMQRESLAKLGETTAGAAHEMNNPLTVISGRAELLFKRLQGERDKAAVGAIVVAARQIAEMIEALHLLSKAPVPVPQTCSLVEVARESIPRARRRTRAKTDVSVDLSSTSGSLVTDPALLSAALVELLCNALEACPNGPVTLIGETLEDGVVFVITDTGPGMDDHTQRHAFDPFFSARESGRGRGLGLTRARVLAQALGGEVVLESEAGAGTTARLIVRALAGS